MSNAELTHHQSMRYSRHVMLPAMDFEGQEKLLAAKVLVVGTIQATIAMQVLACIGSQLEGQVALFDASRGDWQQFKLTRSPTCPVCAGAR